MYTGSGHGAWEATLINLFSPGRRLLIVESGYFSESWAKMAKALRLEVRRRSRPTGATASTSRRSRPPSPRTPRIAIKAVCVVHNETATGMFIPLPEVRAAIDAAKHPALLLVDTISSLGSLDFRMDEWGIDGVVGGSQKGLMLPTGMSFTAASPKAMAAHQNATLGRYYFDWSVMLGRDPQSFVGTMPVNFFYGLQESLRLLDEEGWHNVFARHARLAEAVRRCVKVWAGNNGPQLFCTNPARYSDSVTAVVMPEGHDADAMRATARQRFNVSLGGGLGKLEGQGVPHRPSRRSERADGAGHAGQRGDGAAAERRAARQGRRRGGDGLVRRGGVMAPKFLTEPAPERGVALAVVPGVWRVVADNPGPMTYHGTNTYLIEDEVGVTVLDPGPDDPAHVEAVVAAAGGRIARILLSHGHRDHTGAVGRLRAATKAPVFGWSRA